MPFDFQAYDQKCAALTAEELQREWQHYTRLITGAATSTTVSGLALPLTLGVSSVGIAMAAPAIHNARKKREIIERHLQRHDARHVTRKRDVLGGAAVSGTIGVVTLGVGTMGADAVAQQGAEHGINAIVANETAIKVVTHAALDGVGMGVEHMHTDRVKKREARKAFEKAGTFQAVDDAKAREAGYAYNYQTANQQQYPYGLQAQVTGASSSRLSVASIPPPYSPGPGQSIPGQQPTQYQPTAINSPVYYTEQYPQYATVDAKVDPYVSAAPDARSGEPKSNDMDDLIANIDQQLKMTETSPPPQTGSIASLSYKAGPVVTQYELEGGQEIVQPQVQLHPQEFRAPQQATIEVTGGDQIHQISQPTALSQPDASLPKPPGHIQSLSAQNTGQGHAYSQIQPAAVSPEHPPMTPQSTASSNSYHGQNSQAAINIAQPVPTYPTAPLSERYVPTPMTPPSHDSIPQAHHQQSIQPQVPYVPTPMTPMTPQSFQQHEPGQAQTYFPPPPPSASTPRYQSPKPVVSKRKSIMAAVALKATQTLSQHRTPSASAYHQPQYSAPSPQPQGQSQMYPPQPQQPQAYQHYQAQPQQNQLQPQPQQPQAYQQYHTQPQQSQLQPQPQQFQAQQHWPQPQQQAYQDPHYRQPTQSVEEPVYAPVPVPQAYSTRPQSQVFPPTPMSPPNIPTVQPLQQPGYFPPPAEYKPGYFGVPGNAVIPPKVQGQGYYSQG